MLTVRSKSVAAVALTATVAGSLHVAPRGAPVQLRVAVPLTPSPPIARVYEPVCPAFRLSEPGHPGATFRPKPGLPMLPEE